MNDCNIKQKCIHSSMGARVVVLVVYLKTATLCKTYGCLYFMDLVIVTLETVGVGQSEVDIVKMQILH